MMRNIGQQAWNHENNRKTRRGADGIDFEQDADDILSTRKKIQSTTVERSDVQGLASGRRAPAAEPSKPEPS